jgi:hypothetical protein
MILVSSFFSYLLKNDFMSGYRLLKRVCGRTNHPRVESDRKGPASIQMTIPIDLAPSPFHEILTNPPLLLLNLSNINVVVPLLEYNRVTCDIWEDPKRLNQCSICFGLREIENGKIKAGECLRVGLRRV